MKNQKNKPPVPLYKTMNEEEIRFILKDILSKTKIEEEIAAAIKKRLQFNNAVLCIDDESGAITIIMYLTNSWDIVYEDR